MPRSKSKARSAAASPAQHQEVDFEEEGEEAEAEDQQDEQASTGSLQKEVKDLSAKLNQVLGAVAKLTKQVNAPSILQEAAGAQSAPGSVSGDSLSSESTVPVYSGERLALCVGEADINLEHDPQFRHLSHQWNQAFERALREGSKSLKPTDRNKVNVLSCASRAILLLQSRAKVSAEERDCIEETIEIILAELEEIQVRLQFHPEVAKKISESLKATAASRRSRVGHIFGVPAASSELTSLVVRVQEKLAEEAIRSIHSHSVAKSTKTDQEADFATERKKLKQEHNDTKRELAHLKQVCARNNFDTSTRKQREEQKGAQRASKGGRPDKKSTAASTASPAADDAAAGADA
jgi:hypothetical protein